jgi:peptidoglycan/xylan/chitin deacetylase (PgdA/CDA1 family)
MACFVTNPPSVLFINTDNIGKPGYLDKGGIKYLSQNHIIGSHGHTHADMTKTQEVEYNLYYSKKILQDITGKKIRHFAFPYGAYDRYSIELAELYYDHLYIVKNHTKVLALLLLVLPKR